MRNIVVGDLIKIKEFNQQLRLLTRVGVGLNNVVSHVTIMEAPDFYEWVTGGAGTSSDSSSVRGF